MAMWLLLGSTLLSVSIARIFSAAITMMLACFMQRGAYDYGVVLSALHHVCWLLRREGDETCLYAPVCLESVLVTAQDFAVRAQGVGGGDLG